MIPQFKGVGTAGTDPAWPSHNAGDFGLLACDTKTITPAGWTPVKGYHQTKGGRIFYRFAYSDQESQVKSPFGVITTYTGVNTANPIVAVTKSKKPASVQEAGKEPEGRHPEWGEYGP